MQVIHSKIVKTSNIKFKPWQIQLCESGYLPRQLQLAVSVSLCIQRYLNRSQVTTTQGFTQTTVSGDVESEDTGT